MIQVPRFAAHMQAQVIEGDGVVLGSQAGFFVLKGRIFELVAPLIDGQRSSDEIVDQLQNRASAAEVYYALAQLEQKGYIRENQSRTSKRI